MKAKVLTSVLIAASYLIACMLPGCTTGGRLVDGTETGNPELTACIKKMASATFNALDSDNSWKPDDFLNPQTGGALSKAPAQSIAMPSGLSIGLRKTLSVKSDTVLISDTVEIVYDTIFVIDTIHVSDTVKINKVLFVSDTVVDTFMSKTGNDTLCTFIKRQVRDSVTVFDNVVVADTIIQPRKKVIIKLYQYREGTPIAFIRADSLWIADTKNDVIPQPLNIVSGTAVGPISWGVASVTYDIASASARYAVVNAPLLDTMVIAGNKNNLSVVSSQSFMARSKIMDGIIIELAQYNRLDSILSVMRYYPLAIDSVESLSVAYSVDPGANMNSGSDDLLMGIHQKMVYRLGPLGSMNIAIIPEASGKGLGLKGDNPLVSIVSQNVRGLHGIFDGTMDPINGLSGVYEFGGKKYQIYCDRNLNVTIAEKMN
jgi:hypothetical protein